MVSTMELANLNLTSDAKLLQVYGDGQFSTFSENGLLYLLSTTIVSKYGVIATIDAKKNCMIYNRDKANLFVDWSWVHFGKEGSVESLSDDTIKEYLADYLSVDIESLLSFKKQHADDILHKVIAKYPERLQKEIISGLKSLKVWENDKVPILEAYTKEQMEEFYNRKMYYACFDIARQKYDMTNNFDFSKTFKNGSCGSWRKIESDPNSFMLVFNKSDDRNFLTRNIDKQVREDLTKSSYDVANKFLKFETKLSKSIDTLVEIVTSKNGLVDVNQIYYPIIEQSVESIAKKIRQYQRVDDDKEKKILFSDLKNLYCSVYNELQMSQNYLKKLHEFAEGIK